MWVKEAAILCRPRDGGRMKGVCRVFKRREYGDVAEHTCGSTDVRVGGKIGFTATIQSYRFKFLVII